MISSKPPRLQTRTNSKGVKQWVIRYWEYDKESTQEKRRVHVIPESFQSKQRAHAYHIEFIKQFYGQPDSEDASFKIGVIGSSYLNFIEREKAFRTWERYQRAVERFLVHVSPNCLLKDIGREDIMSFRHELIEKRNLMPKTVNSDMGVIKSFFYWIIKQEKYGLTQSPYRNIPEMKEQPRPFVIFSHQQIQQIRKEANKRKYSCLGNVYAFLSMTGMRRNEICHMTWDWLSPDWKHISIQPVDVEYKDKQYTFNPKGNQIRRFPTTKAMRCILRHQKEINGDIPFVFTYRRMRSALDKHLSNQFQELVLDLKLDKEFPRQPTLHDFRHTAATRLVQAGIDVAQLMMFMGWESLEVAQNYIHAFKELDEKEMRKMWTR